MNTNGTQEAGKGNEQEIQPIPISPIPTALLIDYDSININLLLRWIDSFRYDHYFLLKRAYCDWVNRGNVVQKLMLAAFELIQVPIFSSQGKKNGVDIRLSIDAVEACMTNNHIQRYIIFASDSDYVSLVVKLRERNKYVIFVGNRDSTSPALRAYCDEFYYLDQIQPQQDIATVEPTVDQEREFEEAFALCNQAIQNLISRGKVKHINASLISDEMKKDNKFFDFRRLNYTRWSDFLLDAAPGKIKLLPKEGDTHYVDIITDTKPATTPTKPAVPTLPLQQKEIDTICQLYAVLATDREYIGYSELIQKGGDLKKLNYLKEDPTKLARQLLDSGMLQKFRVEDKPFHDYIRLDLKLLEKAKATEKPAWHWKILFERHFAQLRIPLDFTNTLKCYKIVCETLAELPAMNRDVALTTIIDKSEIRSERANNQLTLLQNAGVIDFNDNKVTILETLQPAIMVKLVCYVRSVLKQQFQTVHAEGFRDLLMHYELADSPIKAELESAIVTCSSNA
jgi:uncharacterized LabA/DUF88 family protein